MKKRYFLLCLSLLALLSGLWGCAFLSPTAAPPTVTPTPTLPSMLVHPALQCSTTEESPYNSPPPICDIVPLVTTFDEVRQQSGNRQYHENEARLVSLPGQPPLPIKIWSAGCADVAYVTDGRVFGVSYWACELTLEKMVSVYGPPARLYLSVLCEGGEDFDCSSPPFDMIWLVWPEGGVEASSSAYDLLYLDSEGHLLPFSPDFGIDYISYYPPFTLDEAEDYIEDYIGGDEFAWPGFAE